jgi:hypothetical protein
MTKSRGFSRGESPAEPLMVLHRWGLRAFDACDTGDVPGWPLDIEFATQKTATH